MPSDLLARATALARLVGESSEALNGRYRFTLTGSILTVSDGRDWSLKTVTTSDGEERSEPSVIIVQAINKGWYVRLDGEVTQ